MKTLKIYQIIEADLKLLQASDQDSHHYFANLITGIPHFELIQHFSIYNTGTESWQTTQTHCIIKFERRHNVKQIEKYLAADEFVESSQYVGNVLVITFFN